MSIVQYGGVCLPYAQTTDFDQSPVYDEQGHTDWCLTKFDIKVQCLLNVQYLSLLAPDLTLPGGATATANPADIMKVIRARLLKPRQTLSFTFNGVELLPRPQGNNPGTVDAKNGPQPQTCTILQLTNSLFILQYHITAHYWENNLVTPGGDPLVTNRAGNNVLFNRWSEAVEFDASMYMRRRREGKYVIRSDNVDGKTADALREQMAVVGVPIGMVRESSSYTVDPSGLGIAYRVTDRQVYRMPPAPAYEAQGDYVETATSNSAVRWGEVYVRLRGPQGENPGALIEIAASVGLQKIRAGQPLRKRGEGGLNLTGRFGNCTLMSIKQNLYDNVVEFRARVQLRARKARTAGLTFGNFPLDTPGSTFGYTPGYPTYGIRGSAGGALLLQAAAYYDPSVKDNPILQGQNFGKGQIPGQAGRTKES